VIVWGTRDIIVSGKKLREMASQLPDARMSVYEGASHSAYKDQPERFSKELLELYGLARRKPGF
jgi:pimeloyl-ACP methyl ester carboxylesterase